MKTNKSRLGLAAFIGLSALAVPSAHADPTHYMQANLVSDVPGLARVTDPSLVNPWGMAFVPNGPFWINDNGAGIATLYQGTGNKMPVAFTIPAPAGSPAGTASAPTGMIWNATFGFLVPGTKLPALFIFSTEDGTVSAWAPNEPVNPLNAVLAVDNSPARAVYKGLAAGTNFHGNYLYATNFRAGTIDVFDSKFAPANARLAGTFADPNLPAGYAPFGIANIGGNLWVSYALQNNAKHDDVSGAGHGFIDVFDTDGHLLQRFASTGSLNSPWGIVRAPFGYGQFSGDILVGNFGDGRINAFANDGTFLGALFRRPGQPVVIDGLWGLAFGGAKYSGPQTLFFTAGIDGEAHGLFGSIIAH